MHNVFPSFVKRERADAQRRGESGHQQSRDRVSETPPLLKLMKKGELFSSPFFMFLEIVCSHDALASNDVRDSWIVV